MVINNNCGKNIDISILYCNFCRKVVLYMQMINRVKEIRIKAGLSQYQLARLSGLSQSTVSHIERGVFSPTIESAYKIAAVLGVRVEELFVPEPRELPKPYRAWED